MDLRVVAKLTGSLLALLAAFIALPAVLAAVDRNTRTTIAYGGSAAIVALTALVLRWSGRNAPTTIHRKDALGIVALTWLGLGVFGALPMLVEGAIHSPVSAVFEAVSGFTTTGATVIADVDRLSRATNLWRCMMHWLGGMGIVVLFVAVFPHFGVGARHLFRTEVPGPITEGLRPRIRHTALVLWWVYSALTVICGVLLWVAGMNWFDAVCHAMSTLGTGGFSTHGASIGYFRSQTIDWIVFVFMLLSGLNFGLYYSALRGRPLDVVRNYETKFFLLVNSVVIGIVFLSIAHRHPDALTALRFAAFQTAAVTTTTGYMTEDFDAYPDLARWLLFLTMFMGACAGSTAGGLKASRVYAALQMALKELGAAVRPNRIQVVRLGGVAIEAGVLHQIAVYICTFLTLFALASTVMMAVGLDLVSAMTSVVACLSSIGPGLGLVGPTQNFEFIPAFGKIILIFCMIAGRLEIFALLAVFTPECWRR